MNGELPLQINHFPSTFFKRYSDLVSIFFIYKKKSFYELRETCQLRSFPSLRMSIFLILKKKNKSMNVFRHTANHERETRTKKFTDFYY